MTFPDIIDGPRVIDVFKSAVVLISPVATAVIAVFVAIISKRQWKTNREKLRLDLYNRRFEIYCHCVDFSEGLYPRYGPVRDSISREELFHRSLRESRFLFPPSAGVYELLKRFDEHAKCILATNAIKITGVQQEKRDLAFLQIEPLRPRWRRR